MRCLAYSCVSAIFSRDLAEESKEFITSCSLGKDIFGRLSWHSAKKLRDQLLDVIRRSKASKGTIMMSLFRPKRLDELLYAPDEVPDEIERQELASRIARMGKAEDHLLDQTLMFMPGRIMYFEKTHTEVVRGCLRNTTRSTYAPTWINDREKIQEVQISSRLILDHMPDYLMKVLRQALDKELTEHLNRQKRVLSNVPELPKADLDV